MKKKVCHDDTCSGNSPDVVAKILYVIYQSGL